MTAAILSIGDELVTGVTVDTNASWLATRLAERGISVAEMRVVGDDRQRIAAAVEDLSRRSGILVITGGLGPTPDDLTREALGDVLAPNTPLEFDEAAAAAVERWFARSGRAMPLANRKQAMRPRGADLLRNANGTAPGITALHGSCRVIALPGVPREMKPMFEAAAEIHLPRSNLSTTVIRAVHTCGIGESALAECLGDILARTDEPRVGTAASLSVVSVRIYSAGPPQQAATAANEEALRIEALLGPYVFGRDDDTLASSLGALLRAGSQTLATAESCTGGLLGQMLTDVPGSSAWYVGGWITYSNELKQRCLAVPGPMLEKHGAVSEAVARAMAEGAIRETGANLGLSITGVAGPDGGSDAKPVGTVFVGCAWKDDAGSVASAARRFQFGGDRAAVRDRSAKTALQIARFHLLRVGGDVPLLGERPSVAAR